MKTQDRHSWSTQHSDHISFLREWKLPQEAGLSSLTFGSLRAKHCGPKAVVPFISTKGGNLTLSWGDEI